MMVHRRQNLMMLTCILTAAADLMMFAVVVELYHNCSRNVDRCCDVYLSVL